MNQGMIWKKTHCGKMDHGGCALQVGVTGNRIVRVKGDPDGYLNRGYICPKALASPDRLTHPDRLRYPLKRKGERGSGDWERISWGDALSLIAENLNRVKAKHGAKAVAFCQGMPKGLEHFVLIRLANLFGSPNVVVVQDVCHAPREISGLHTCGFYPVADFRHPAERVVLWGSNITATNEEGGICRLLMDRIKEGTRLMVVDPRRTELADRADHWLQLKPGTDGALAMAFLNVIITEGLYDTAFVRHWTYGFEALAAHAAAYTPEKMSPVTGLSAEQIVSGARAYAAANPAAMAWGNAVEHTVNAFDTTRALICLMAVCGNLDVPGGNIEPVEPAILPLGKFVRADRLPGKFKEMIHAHHGAIPKLMTVPPAYFRKAVLSDVPYPVRAAYVQCANPLPGYADSRQTFRALMHLDFFAVADIFMTPTASLADVVLPAATHFECDDIGHYGLGHGIVLARPKVVDPPPECRSDMSILNDLGKALTSPGDWYDDERGFLDLLLDPSGLTWEQFAERGYLVGSNREKKYLEKGFKTPTGKVELALSRAGKFGLQALPGFNGLPEEPDDSYPLVLTCAKDPRYLHSAYRWIERLRQQSPEPLVRLHPETAAAHGIANGDAVVIETRTGRIVQTARLTDGIRPDVVFASYGWWFPDRKGQGGTDWQSANYNMLTSTEKLGREFGTPNLKGVNCRIRKER